MKVYQPIEGLLERRRRTRRSRLTFGVFGILGLGLVLYWGLSAYRNSAAEARTDRIISLSAPDFTAVLADTGHLLVDAATADSVSARRTRPPEFVQGVLETNQTLFVAMRDEGVDSRSIQGVVDALSGTFNFRRARPGDRWEARLDDGAQIISFRYSVSPEEIYEATRSPDGSYTSGRVEVPTETVLVGLGGTVVTSIYDAVAETGEGTQLATRLREIFGWDVDFSREARPGDRFRLLVEKVLLDGELLRYGRVLAAEYTGRAVHLTAFAHTSPDGRTEYYTAEGEALRRTFLRSPLTYRRISSTFTRRRFHPILRRYRPHLGVDYTAPTGTPIWSVADGRVRFAGYRGGNGNLVVIEHDDGYESLYAHLSRFADGIRRGREVHQGEVLGYVGNTGLSTGPHLHFGIRHDGDYIDPLGLESVRGPRLRGEDLNAFSEAVTRYQRELEAIEIAAVDLSDLPVEDTQTPVDLPSDFGMIEEEESPDDE